LCRALLPALLALPLAAAAAEQRTFATPEAAVDALAAALKANDETALIELFGDKYKNVVSTGSPSDDAARRAEAAGGSPPSARSTTARPTADPAGRCQGLALPGSAGSPGQRLAVRERTRGGGNTEPTHRPQRAQRHRRAPAYVDAQREYASRDRDGDGVLQYAAKLGSAPGKFDGLYWPADTARAKKRARSGRSSPRAPPISPDGPKATPIMAITSGSSLAKAQRGRRRLQLPDQRTPHRRLRDGRLRRRIRPERRDDLHRQPEWQDLRKDLGPNSRAVAEKLTAFDPGAGWRATSP
jgi:hypothetical protein